MTDDFWTTNLEDEPCDGCGVRPSKHQGHGAFSCKACYDASWCPMCHYELRKNHVCVTPEQARLNQLDNAAWSLATDPDNGHEALLLAEELTREEQSVGYVPTCKWCGTIHSSDGEHFTHKLDCKWKRFRDFFAEAYEPE